MNIAEAAHITSTVRPPRTPQSARTSQYHAFGTSASFDTGFTVEAQRREKYSIEVRLSNVTTAVRPAHTPQSARTSQKHAFGSSACFVAGRRVDTAEAKCQMYIQSASWRSLHHNTRLTSSIEYGKRHYYLENATISIYTRRKLLVFSILSPTC